MINFDAVQEFDRRLEQKYCDEIGPDLIGKLHSAGNTAVEKVSLDPIAVKIDCSDGSNFHCDFDERSMFYSYDPQDDIIRSVMTEAKKSEITAYMADILKTVNDYNDDTLSAIFVSFCYFGYLWDIFSPESTDSIVDTFCKAISDKKLKKYLSVLGRGILNRGYHSELSAEQIRKAIELYPENEMSAVFDFIFTCVECDNFFMELKKNNTPKNDDEYDAIMKQINHYILDLSQKFSKIDEFYQELLLRPYVSSFEDVYMLPFPDTCFLPHIYAKKIPVGFMESLTAYKNPVVYAPPIIRDSRLEKVMPCHSDYMHTDFNSSEEVHDQKREYAFYGVGLYLDVLKYSDFLRNYALLPEAYEQLEKSEEEKKSIVTDYTHTYGNMSAETLNVIANTLLKNEDAEVRKQGRKVMIECSIKLDLINQVRLLNLQFKNNYEEARKRIKEGFCFTTEDGAVDVKDITEKAIMRVMYSLLYDRSRNKKLRKGQYNFCKMTGIDDLDIICDDFENTVLLGGVSVLEWLRNKGMNLNFTVEGGFNNLYAVKDSQSELFIRDIITECFFNMIKYSDLTKPTYIGFTSDDNYFRITFRNTSSEYAYKFSGEGLSSKKAKVELLNKECSADVPYFDIKWSKQNDEFVTEATISRQFMEGSV